MIKKILILTTLLLFSIPTITNATYTLTEDDKNIAQKIEIKLTEIINKNQKFSYDWVITFLESYKDKKTDERIKSIFEEIIKGLNISKNRVTILEWRNIFDIDNYLYSRKLIQKWEYINYVQNQEKIIALSEFFPFLYTQKTLEWYLYPDTYEIYSDNFKINEFVIKQLEAFETKVYQKLFIDENWNSKYMNEIIESIVNLSSIVEKEEKNPLEKPTIAGILKKRVKEYWNIWADITVCYPYKLTENQCKSYITQYINTESEYNTRFIIWLPPTPICNPSYETINATLNHKETEYYYYLHDTTTWEVYYAKTLEEHNENKQLYLK